MKFPIATFDHLNAKSIDASKECERRPTLERGEAMRMRLHLQKREACDRFVFHIRSPQSPRGRGLKERRRATPLHPPLLRGEATTPLYPPSIRGEVVPPSLTRRGLGVVVPPSLPPLGKGKAMAGLGLPLEKGRSRPPCIPPWQGGKLLPGSPW